jgi:uncharacterized membrane protein YozB (DUF420 family)
MATRFARSDRDFVAWIVGGILLVVLVGFSRSFFLRPLFGGGPEWAAQELIFIFHGFVFTAWFVLLAVQTYLIRSRSLTLHRRLGWAAVGLGAAIVVLGTYSALRAANRPGVGFHGVPFPPEHFLIVPLLGMATFAVFLGLAVLNRANGPSHKRLMLLASISILGAPVARIPMMMPMLPFWLDAIVYSGFVIALAVWDIQTRGKLRPETLWGGPAIVLLNIAALPLASAPAWQAFALNLMSLTGPP